MIVSADIRHRITVAVALFYFAVMALYVYELATGVGSPGRHLALLGIMAAWLLPWWWISHRR
jgi:hypothetical protein